MFDAFKSSGNEYGKRKGWTVRNNFVNMIKSEAGDVAKANIL